MTGRPRTPLVGVAELAERLRALGVDPSPRELAEALWLAGHVAPAAAPSAAVPASEPGREVPARQESSAATASSAWKTPRPGRRSGGRAHDTRPAQLYSGEQSLPGHRSDAGSVTVRVPVATALPHPLTLQRALRPLQRYHPPSRTRARLVDEQATAEHAAETGLLLPVLRTTPRREARLRLLMDASSSTIVWDRAFEDLRQLCAGLGSFREVTTHHIHEGDDGRLLVGTGRTPERELRPVEQLRDPTGRQLTLLLSDGAGPLWRDGRLQRLLHHWGQAAPVALVQPLPQRMWQDTHLPALPGTLRRHEGLGARLEFAPSYGDAPHGGLPVPVLGLSTTGLGAWARLLSGQTGLSLPAAAAWVLPDHPAYESEHAPTAPPPDSVVRAFRQTASPDAQQLIRALSAVPLTLPVMQLVQRAILPQSGPQTLAEVVLSGLLRRGEGEGWYQFLPGIRELLLRSLPLGDAVLVLKHCGAYVDQHFGRGARNFPALALDRLMGEAAQVEARDIPQILRPFAEVSEMVVGRYRGASVPVPRPWLGPLPTTAAPAGAGAGAGQRPGPTGPVGATNRNWIRPEVDVLVEIDPARWVSGAFGWRVRFLRDGTLVTVASDTSQVPRGRLWELIRPHVAPKVLDDRARANPPIVQFSLPRDLMNEPVDQWQVSRGLPSLGRIAHVVVRSSERVGVGLSEVNWHARWEKVSKGPLEAVPLVPQTPASGTDSAALLQTLVNVPWTAVPVHCRHPESAPGFLLLRAALTAGYPLMLWSRSAGHSDCAPFYRRAQDLVREAGTVGNLLDRVRDLRGRSVDPEAVEPDAVWARNLTVFYDPPTPRLSADPPTRP